MSGRYDDILFLPHPTSKKHPRMSAQERAAQFSPFAALTGHQAVLREAARQTQERRVLDEYEQDALARKLALLQEHLAEEPEVQLSYFKEDARKAGGEYVRQEGRVKKLDLYRRVLLMADGTRVPLDDLFGMEGALFSS